MPSARSLMRRPAAALGLAVAVALAAVIAVAARGPSRPLSVQEQTDNIAAGLRCPVCRNLSVADSPSRLAEEMRSTIGRKLREGESPREIRAYFVDRYGEWILLAPRRKNIGLVPWLGPAVALAAGGVLAATLLRRRRNEAAVAVTEAERERIHEEVELLEEPE